METTTEVAAAMDKAGAASAAGRSVPMKVACLDPVQGSRGLADDSASVATPR